MAGILIQRPLAFFEEVVGGLGSFDDYGVGQLFFPRDQPQADLKELVKQAATDEGFTIEHWRSVPTNNEDLGDTARQAEPDVKQFFVTPDADLDPDDLDTALYVLRNVIEHRVEQREPAGHERFYICSLDRRKLVYKGLLTN